MSFRDTVTGDPAPEPDPSTTGWPSPGPGDPTVSLPNRSASHLRDPDGSPRLAPTETAPHQPPPRPEPEPGLPAIPGYQLLAVLGRGAMGTVYRAVEVDLGREVALKLIHPTGRDPATVRARFNREVRSLARIDHTNIVPIYRVGEWHGFPYFAMKYVPGGPLSRHLDRFRADLRAACRLLAKVARAVHRLHADGILHRDLKPLNILLGEKDEPQVADFGLAKWLGEDSDLTATGAAIGTRAYMSPELTSGERPEDAPASDIWALGVVLYEVLAGRRPFDCDNPVELSVRIREVAPPPISDSNPGVPAELEAVVRKCLAKKPEGRYATAAEVADDLERWLDGQPVSAPLTEPGASRRRRWAAAVGVLVLLAGVVAGVAAAGRSGHRKDPPPATIAERLRNGPVDLIGPTGLPLVPYTPVPGHSGQLTADRDGCCTLSSFAAGIIELVNEPLPIPLQIEADVALSKTVVGSLGGVYVGRKTWDGQTGMTFRSLVAATLQTNEEQKVPEGFNVRQTRSSTIYSWRGEGQGAVETVRQLDPVVTRVGKDDDLIWHPVTLTLGPGQVTPSWGNQTLPPVTEWDVIRHLNNPDRRWGLRFAPPALGDGIGLIVVNAELVVRNLKLIPVR